MVLPPLLFSMSMVAPFNNLRSSPNDVEQAFLSCIKLIGSPPQDHGNQVVNIAKTKAAANYRFDNIVRRLKLAC